MLIYKSSKPIHFYLVLVLLFASLLSCKSKTGPTQSNIIPVATDVPAKEKTFEGQWICAEKNWKVVIVKVDATTYNLKWWYNLPSETLEEKASGTYTYYADLDDIRYKGFVFKFAEDGRLYETSEAVFFTKQ